MAMPSPTNSMVDPYSSNRIYLTYITAFTNFQLYLPNRLGKNMNPRSQWTSRLGFILATTGAAVGLGNIWKFPYMAGDNGGSAFVMVYLICVLLIGLPVMLSEMVIGRRGKHNAVNAIRACAIEAKKSKHWQLLGWWGCATLLLVLSFYSVVAGWSLAYLIRAWQGEFTGMSANQVLGVWHHFLANPTELLIWHGVFMFITLWIVARGVQRGLELASKIVMPLLFFILVILVGYATSTPGFIHGFQFLLDPNFHKITPYVVISAMGHAFFTLAVGAGCMLVYASYLPSNIKLGSAVLTIAGLDVLVAILAGLAIFPLVFTYHLTPQGGPGLMFQTLPIAFAKMEGGRFFGGLFFLLLFFAALSSSISLAEPLVDLLTEKYTHNRTISSIIIGVLAWTLGIASVLSFNYWQDIKLIGRWPFFIAITDLATNIMLPIGGFFFAIFAGWIMTKNTTEAELSFSRPWIFKTWLFLVRFIAPIGILIILISALV